ncbi:DNA-directed RNA polymerase III subunit RPC8 [Geodia barretti]|uniref:DNA-directed RNA polymerase III subunit RPC8 n=1 Tax=Geodia barretti TaxID=519541 RepID=A0AA35RZU0_GEOBA|nr:DNA-directed RNA polymerase III subunit RPC8 [Geodia barretti]
MFVLAELEYIIRVEPRRFGKDMKREVRDELNRKFANKVLHSVGLCIALYDITRVGDSYILPGDGASHTKVRFRVVVFRPFVDEILVGKIRSCSSEGVRVSLGFFDDVFIPHQSLQHPKRFDQEEQLWVWQYESEGEPHDMFMDLEEEVRFRVVQETFVDTIPKDGQTSS